MLRRAVALLLCVVGAALLGAAAWRYSLGALARGDARAAWNAAEARRAVAAVHAALDGGSDAIAFRAGAPVARLVIPRLALDEIVVEGMGEDELNAGPGHLPGSALPGEVGNAVISAHRDRHFHGLDELQVGDTIVTESMRERVVWTVRDRRVVDRWAPALFVSTEPLLTLTTCWPVRYLGPAPERLILSAQPVARTPRA